MRHLSLVLALFVPLSAAASEEDFQRFYNAALRLHESLEYERALEQLSLARRQAETGDQMSKVNLAEGVVLADLNRMDEALAAFKAGLLLSPDAKLPAKVSPRIATETPFAPANLALGAHSVRVVNKDLGKEVTKQFEVKDGSNVFRHNFEE